MPRNSLTLNKEQDIDQEDPILTTEKGMSFGFN
jgi:hypothetical protein